MTLTYAIKLGNEMYRSVYLSLKYLTHFMAWCHVMWYKKSVNKGVLQLADIGVMFNECTRYASIMHRDEHSTRNELCGLGFVPTRWNHFKRSFDETQYNRIAGSRPCYSCFSATVDVYNVDVLTSFRIRPDVHTSMNNFFTVVI